MSGIARLGRDAEIRYIPSGQAVASLSLAFSYGKKNTDGSRNTQWIDAALWGKQAESLAQYLKKGTLVSVVIDAPHIETYDTLEGKPGLKMAGTVINIEFAGGGNKQQDEQQHQNNSNADYDDGIPF
jgi:single-strand DNA-binding protein